MEWKLNTPSDWDWESLSVCSPSTIQTPHRHPLQINYFSHTEEDPNANPLVPDKPVLDDSSPCSQERAKTSRETPVLRRPSASRASSSTQNCSRCQVEGCNLDLTSAKEYHRRHRICAHHSKSPRVIVAGMERRFCQQCSRFHDLSEFDDKKRSCRRRLSAHNARRRRPRPFHEFATSSSSSSSLSFSGATGVMSSSVMTPELRRAFSLLSTSSTVFNEAEPAASFGQFVHHGSNISLATHPGMPMPLENWEPSAFSQNIFG